MTFYTRIRLRHGMFWRGRYPGWAELRRWIGGLFAACALIAVLGMVEQIEAATERAIHAEKAAEIYGAKAKVLKDCERGAVGYYYADGRAYQCGGKL